MALSINDLVQRVRDLLNDSPFTTTSSTTGTGTTVAVPDGSLWSDGDIGEWQTGAIGYEQFLVVGDPVGNNLTVDRGYRGTTAESHTSGDEVVQNPTFTGRQVQQALTRATKELWPFVYKTGSISITPSNARWFDLHANTVGLVRVYQVYNTVEVGRYGSADQLGLEYDFLLPTSIVPSGKGVRFTDGFYHATDTVTVIDQRLITGTSDIPDGAADDPPFAVADCLVHIAAGEVTQASEIARVSQGSDLETTSSVGTGSRLQTGAFYTALGKQKLESLALEYQRHYQPIRFRETG